MKNKILYSVVMGVLSFNISCGPSSEQKVPDTTASPDASSMMSESSYDASKIDAAAPVVEITLLVEGNTMAEMRFDQAELRVKAGSTVKLTLINHSKDASMQHNFVLVDDGSVEKVATEGIKAGVEGNFTPKSSSVLVGTKVLLPGETTSITFPAPEKGNYEFVCTYPGHWQKMRGKFIVE